MYPEDSIQAFIEPWWVTHAEPGIKRGLLLRAFVPHVRQDPMILVPTGRQSPTDHSAAKYRIEPLNIKQPPRAPSPPVAGLTWYEREVYAVYRAKKRPVLVVSTGGPEIPRGLMHGAPKWQTTPTVFVAPFYGAERGGGRAGFPEEFVSRVRRCDYPQYLWDRLPIGSPPQGSMLRLDHIQPLGRNPNAYESTGHCLSDHALLVLDEWLNWLFEGDLPREAVLHDVRKGLLGTED